MRRWALLLCLAIVCAALSGCAQPGSVASSLQSSSVPVVQATEEPAQQAGPALYSYETQELFAEREGRQIYGVLYTPQGIEGKRPAVIFSHGFGGNHSVGAQYAQALAERGYVVYCFDFCGGSPNSQSDGSTLEMSIFTEQADLEAVIAMIQALDIVDSDNLFLMGSSQGGAVSAITAAAQPEAIRGMVLLYPAFVLVDRANQMFQSAQEIPDTLFFLWMDVGRAYFEPLLGYDIYRAIAPYERDVLLIHGDADSIVPLDYSKRALEAYPSAELKVIPGGGHGFYGQDAQQAIAYTLEYLQAHQVPS